MQAALIILILLVAVGTILYIHHRLTGGDDSPDPQEEKPTAKQQSSHGEFCCGTHIVCEKDLPASDKIIYYDDEELDAYVGREADGYSDEEIEQFRDVLLTLLPTDIAGWNHSLELRKIAMPQEVRDEMLLIVSEARMALNQK